MTIMSQYPTCRHPTCINRIETHAFNLFPIGRNVPHTSNKNLQSPTVTPNPTPNTISIHDQIPNPSDPIAPGPTPTLPTTQPLYSNYPSMPLLNNPFPYSLFHNNLLNPMNIPTTSPIPYSSPTIIADLSSQSTSLWSTLDRQSSANSLWSTLDSHPPTLMQTRSNIESQGRANSCVFDQPLS